MPKFNIQHSEDQTITVLKGKVLDPVPPQKIVLSGNIHAVSDFIKRRYGTFAGTDYQFVEPGRAVVLVDVAQRSIMLHLDPQDLNGTCVFAQLETTPELAQFQINTSQQMSREQIVKLFRFNRRFFDPGIHGGLLEAFQKLQLSGTTELAASSDARGNKANAFSKLIDTQRIPTEFVLNIPIFKGFGPERFRVEICLEATDASVRFWFESVELLELLESRTTEIINKELECCQDFVIIHK